MSKTLALCILAFAVGCDGETTISKSSHRSAMTSAWRHNAGSGTPHRGSVLRDGTEIITIGHHDHGSFLLLIRYADEERFTVFNQDGDITDMTEGETETP